MDAKFRGIPLSQQRLWAYFIERENKLRLNWLKKHEPRLEEIASQANEKHVPDGVKTELEARILRTLEHKGGRTMHKDNDVPDIPPGAIHTVMKPVEKEIKALLREGRKPYLNERYKTTPENRYYFPETTAFQHGWKMWGLGSSGSPFARQQVIQNSFYRRRGAERDPEWYKEPAKLSPQVCCLN